jgi:hypothetical protein
MEMPVDFSKAIFQQLLGGSKKRQENLRQDIY